MNDFNFQPLLRGDRATALPAPLGGGAVATDKEGEVPVLTRYLRIAIRWKWLILGSVLAALVVALVATLLMTRLYTASATIEISREANKVVPVGGVEPETNVVDQEFYQTQYGLLKSRSLAEQVVRELGLANNPAFFEMFGKPLDDNMFADKGNPRLRASERDQRARDAADILLENLDINPVRLSRLVDINFTSPDPAFSAKVVNAWTANFIESNLERRFEATSYARKFLEDRLEQLRRRLEASERQLVAFAGSQRIINLQTQGGAGQPTTERPLVADDLVAINTELADATADRVQAQSRLEGANGGAVTEALQNTTISNLRQRRAELAAEYSRLMVQFEPEYPAAKAVATQIDQLDRSIAREEARVGQTLRNTYQDAMEREETLRSKVGSLKNDLLDLRRRSIQYNIYQREVDTNRELYNGLLQRYKEIGVAGGVGTNNVSIVDPARPPERPSSPRLLLNLALALVLGSLIGAGLTFAFEQVDETIADPAAIVRALNLPLLGTIPKTKDVTPLDALRDRKSSLVEAYLSVQTSLEFSTEHGVPRTITVSSTRAAEGKSTSAFAIAASLARAKRKVILIDGDMRSPSMHGLLDLKNDAGLSNFLAGQDDARALVHHIAEWGFDAMTAGPPPPNAGELLTGERFPMLLSRLSDEYDHVIIDSPPVLGLADAPLIASRVEGTIYTVESHGTRAGLIRVAIGRLVDANAHILGTVLTKFEAKRAHLGYGYDYGYGYGGHRAEAA